MFVANLTTFPRTQAEDFGFKRWFDQLFKDEAQTALFKDPVRTAQ